MMHCVDVGAILEQCLLENLQLVQGMRRTEGII